MNIRKLAPYLLCAIVLLCFFLVVPSYTDKQQLKGAGYSESLKNPQQIDNSYTLIFDWLSRQGDPDSFRYQLVPSIFSANIAIAHNSPSWYQPYQGEPATLNYSYYALKSLLSPSMTRWGSVIAPTNVKYVIVVWNTTETDTGLGNTAWMAQGNATVGTSDYGPHFFGNYTNYIALLDSQTDLKRLIVASDYLIYENLDFIPHIQAFPTANYVIGGLQATYPITKDDAYSVNDSVLIYGNHATSQDALPYADAITYYNSNGTGDATGKVASYIIDNPDLFNSSRIVTNRQNVYSTNLVCYQEGNTWGNLTLTMEGVQDSGLATTDYPRQVLGYIFNESLRVFSGWDYLKLNVKQSTNTTEVYLLHDLQRNVYDDVYKFQTIPNTWNELLIPLTGNFSYIDGMQIHATTDMPNEPITITLRSAELIDVQTQISTTLSLDSTEIYNINPINRTMNLKAFQIDGETATRTIKLSAGLHTFTFGFDTTDYFGGFEAKSQLDRESFESPVITNNVKKGDTEYVLTINSSKPFFLVLGESYNAGWVASIANGKAPHFIAYSYLNGYFINETGSVKVTLSYNGESYLVPTWIGMAVFFLLVVFCGYLTIRGIVRRRSSATFGNNAK